MIETLGPAYITDAVNGKRVAVVERAPIEIRPLVDMLRERGAPGPYTVHLGERVSIDIEMVPSHIERIIRHVEDRERRYTVVEYDKHARCRPDRNASTAAMLRASKRRNANKQARVARRRNRK